MGNPEGARLDRWRWVAILAVALPLASAALVAPPMQEVDEAVAALRGAEAWAWLLAIGLVWADLLLPVPQSSVITALGIVYGTALGGLLGSVALVTSGLFAYSLMRTPLRRLVVRVTGASALARMQGLFETSGAWAIALSRSLPFSVPEVLVCLAGLSGMRLRPFLGSLAIGSVPIAFFYAAIGDGWSERPLRSLALSAVLPLATLPLFYELMRWRARSRAAAAVAQRSAS